MIRAKKTNKNFKTQKHQNHKPTNSSHNSSSIAGENQVWIYGKHSFFSAIKNKKRKILKILISENNQDILDNFIKNNPEFSSLLPLIKVAQNDAISLTIDPRNNKNNPITHQGFSMLCSRLPTQNQNDLLAKLSKLKDSDQKLPKLLILDQISDPHNVGAIIRSAIAFGVNNIIFCEHNAPKENATIIKTSVGTIEDCEMTIVVNISNLMEKIKKLGYWCVGLDGEGETLIEDVKKYDNLAIIIGSEGDGIRPLIKKNCDFLAKINIDGKVESLNASVACAITLYELAK